MKVLLSETGKAVGMNFKSSVCDLLSEAVPWTSTWGCGGKRHQPDGPGVGKSGWVWVAAVGVPTSRTQ